MEHKVWLLLGTNLGNRMENLMAATGAIRTFLGTVIKQSHVYETEPWGRTHQPLFFNQVLLIQTPSSALETLHHIKQIEFLLGRDGREKWAPRTLDIDILFFDALNVESPLLTIPHKHLHERRFTLEPLCEIDPDLMHPVFNKTVAELLAACTDPLSVSKLDAVYKF